MSGSLTVELAVGLVVAVPIGAALWVRAAGRSPRTRQHWWAAAALAVGGAVVAEGNPMPLAMGVAAAGLAAAAVIDLSEGRIPTTVAHATTVSSLALMLGYGLATSEWWPITRAVLLTAVLVVAFGGLWLAGQMGFGDVRLAGATVTVMTGGLAAFGAVICGSFVAASVLGVGRRLLGHRSNRTPFAPALLAGWLLAALAAG